MNRIDAALTGQPAGLWPFLPAGYPNINTTAELLRSLAKLNVRGFELGFPFSDPIADGPVIQTAFSRALAGGVKVADVLEMVRGVRQEVSQPILAMVSASIVYRIGVDEFVARSSEVGFDGLIVPDISLEEAPELARAAGKVGLRLCMLIAPTTPPEREKRIAELTTGFLYFVSVQGVTGDRKVLPADSRRHVVELRRNTGRPVVVGFGIGNREQVQEVCGYASGAIVGSAIVRRITEQVDTGRPQKEIVEDITRLAANLAG